MPEIAIPIAQGQKTDADTDFRDTLPVNMVHVQKPVLGSQGYLRSAHGLEQYADVYGLDNGGNWNDSAVNRGHFRVSGFNLVKVDSGVATDLGNVNATSQCAMPYSFNTQAIITNSQVWLYEPVGGLLQITDPDLGLVFDGVWLDGYYLFTDGEFIVATDLNNEFSINPLKYGSSEISPDDIRGLGVMYNDLVAFNRHTTEFFDNTGGSGFPFQRQEGKTIYVGIVGTHTKVKIGDDYAVLGGAENEPTSVYVLSPGRAQNLATREINEILETYTEAELATGVLEKNQYEGHDFVVIHLPRHTLMLDLAAQGARNWTIHKRGTGIDIPARWINGVYVADENKWIFGDKVAPILGELKGGITTQYGEVKEWEFSTPLIMIGGLSVNQIEIKTLPARNLVGDPKVFVSATTDGLTYSKEYIASYGQRYKDRFILYRMGFVPNWVSYKFRGANEQPVAFVSMSASVS